MEKVGTMYELSFLKNMYIFSAMENGVIEEHIIQSICPLHNLY